MKYYINNAACNRLLPDIKDLIPNANMRRRMSHILKMGVGTAMECLKGVDYNSIDAIITATALGCLEDSEKFLKSIIDNNEQLLNPTPFIQSTFNTIGGQIALITGNHCYNVTYSHREHSFESGLLDAIMLLQDGEAKNVLLGAVDETTATQVKIMERMGLYRDKTIPGEGANFFIISSEPGLNPIGIIENLYINNEPVTEDINTEIVVDKSYNTATAEAMYKGVQMLQNSVKRVCIINGKIKIVLKCI
ncbi:MAG: beta-ketoacyl synthase chain length factor [Bacteroidales bacterium]